MHCLIKFCLRRHVLDESSCISSNRNCLCHLAGTVTAALKQERSKRTARAKKAEATRKANLQEKREAMRDAYAPVGVTHSPPPAVTATTSNPFVLPQQVGVVLAARSGTVPTKPNEHHGKIYEEIMARRQALTSALAERGLALRADSRLCEMYLESGEKCGWTLAGIVERMCQMKYLHEYTNYSDMLWRIRENYRDCGMWWDAEETQAEAENTVVSRRGGWPAEWPWLRRGRADPPVVAPAPHNAVPVIAVDAVIHNHQNTRTNEVAVLPTTEQGEADGGEVANTGTESVLGGMEAAMKLWEAQLTSSSS